MMNYVHIVSQDNDFFLIGEMGKEDGRVYDSLVIIVPYLGEPRLETVSSPALRDDKKRTSGEHVGVTLIDGPAMVSVADLKLALADGGELSNLIDAIRNSHTISVHGDWPAEYHVSDETQSLIRSFESEEHFRNSDWEFHSPEEAIDVDAIEATMSDVEVANYSDTLRSEAYDNKIIIVGDLAKWMRAILREIKEREEEAA